MALVASALVAVAVLVMQPWVSCPDDTASAACPVPDHLVTVTTGAWLAAVGLGVAGVATLVRASRHRDVPGTGTDGPGRPPR